MGAHEAHHAIAVAKRQKILAEQAHAHRGAILFGDLFGEHGWLPVAAEKLPGGRSGTNPDQAFVLLSRQHGVFSSFLSSDVFNPTIRQFFAQINPPARTRLRSNAGPNLAKGLHLGETLKECPVHQLDV
jgi:hypothetical protein